MEPLRVDEGHRCLLGPDGAPFFYLGDTCWELFHRATREDADLLLRTRAEQGFTVIQAVALAEFDGLTTPNRYGELPLHDLDPARPNDGYFAHVDCIVRKAAELGLFVGLLPTWGDKVGPVLWGKGPQVFTPENARAYGRFLGSRYRDAPIIWILGGDRPADSDDVRTIWRAMAQGLEEGDGGRHLMTYHPMGGNSCSAWWPPDEPWLDFHMVQSGHSARDIPNYELIERDYALKPTKPTMEGEARYENHAINWKPDTGRFDDFDVRQAAYWSLLAGGCGFTYGCQDVWQLWEPGREPITFANTNWRDALHFPGAEQMRHLRTLFQSYPLTKLVPDQSLIAEGQADGADHLQAARACDGSFALVYLPTGRPVRLNASQLRSPRLSARWYDPRTGEWQSLPGLTTTGGDEFTPPTTGRGNDWVLALDAVSPSDREMAKLRGALSLA
ncbi:MAG: glycoside hydrolase family 140 protein [Armatimonadota bacterium]